MKPSHISALALCLLFVTTGACSSNDEKNEMTGSGGTSAGGGTNTGNGAGGLSNGTGGGNDDGTTGGGNGDGDGPTGGGNGDGDGDDDGPEPGCVVDLECDPPVLPSTGDFGQDCVNRINQFRVGCSCMTPLERWTEAEQCAQANAEYDQGTGVPHSGWRSAACEEESGPLSSQYYGMATNECPGYGSAESVIGTCLKQMYAEGADWAAQLGRQPNAMDISGCSGTCYGRNGHFIAMTNERYTQVACGITSSGAIWSVQNFR